MNVQPAFVIKVAKETENVWVTQMGLDLYLTAKLVLHLKASEEC